MCNNRLHTQELYALDLAYYLIGKKVMLSLYLTN
jgi:hypothetical protein